MTTPEGDDPIERYRQAVELASRAAMQAATGTDLVSASSPESAAVMKSRLAGAHKQVARARKTALEAQHTAKAAVEAKKRELDAMMREMQAQLEPLQKQMARFEDGIDAFNLYLGRDEEILNVADGVPAPAGTTIVLRQLTLAMDEESAIAAGENGIDFQDIDLFVEWLTADPAHVDQLIAEPKGIVAIRPRKRGKEYSGDPWADAAKNKANWKTHWLIRNGEQLWLTTTDFRVGDHMVPTADLFTKMFETRDRKGNVTRLSPGSKEWAAAEELADAYTRHYMKAALVLQGLVDRTKVLHPLPAADFSFLEQRFYDEGLVRVITDDEKAIGTGRQPFFDWLRERGALLEPGMRVLGAFSGYTTGFSLYDAKYESANVSPKGSKPQDGVYVVKRSEDREFAYSFAFDRTDEIWDKSTWSYRPAKAKATCKFSAGDHFVIPIDTVSAEEMQEYLNARTERHAYAVMFPILQAAVKFKLEETAVEQPFREALVAQLIQLDKVDPITEAAIAAADFEAADLISWYKTSNLWHRALDADDSKASKLILAEARRRRRGVDKDGLAITAITNAWAADGDGRELMVIARRSSDYVAVAAETRRYVMDAVSQGAYVTMLFFTAAGVLKERREWVIPTHAQVARWTILNATARWDGWAVGANAKTRLTDTELDEVAAATLAEHHTGLPFEIRYSEFDTERREDRIKCEVLISGTSADNAERWLHIDKRADGITLTWRRERTSQWSYGHYDKPRWEVRYSGELHSEDAIWVDEVVRDSEAARWAIWCDKQLVVKEQDAETWRLTRSIENAWTARAVEAARQRYIDDFGDDELWEEHRKGVTIPHYPHDDRYDARWDAKKPWSLERIVSALVARDQAPYGLTVAEAIAEHGGDNIQINDDVLDLRFADDGAKGTR